MNPFANGAAQTSYSPESDRQGGYIENTTIADRHRQDEQADYPGQQRRGIAGQRGRSDYREPGHASRPDSRNYPPVALDGYCPVSLL